MQKAAVMSLLCTQIPGSISQVGDVLRPLRDAAGNSEPGLSRRQLSWSQAWSNHFLSLQDPHREPHP